MEEEPIRIDTTEQEQKILQQMNEISNSNVASPNKARAISQLQEMLNKIRKEDNQIKY